jgi:CDP-glucose 4,6-dehydratase
MELPLGQRLRELPGPLLLTGHTGFKGTWMTFLLEQLSVPVVGYSLPAEKDSLFDRAERTGAIPEQFSDIRDYTALERFIDLHKPSTIIHMAAQPLVLKSYENPIETFEVNVMGTVNLLNIAFKKDYVKAIVIVTTDKVYRNDNSGRAFVETDPLEGKDPYSASKVAAEAVVTAWQQISKVSGGPRIVSVRAGNVIGGGDFAINRIIPDLIRGIEANKPVEIRNPNSTRPWQHVLDLSKSYLAVLELLLEGQELKCINFGPSSPSLSVEDLVNSAKAKFGMLSIRYKRNPDEINPMEAVSLDLDSSLAANTFGIVPKYSQKDALNLTFNWWQAFQDENMDPTQICKKQIEEFFQAPEIHVE